MIARARGIAERCDTDIEYVVTNVYDARNRLIVGFRYFEEPEQGQAVPPKSSVGESAGMTRSGARWDRAGRRARSRIEPGAGQASFCPSHEVEHLTSLIEPRAPTVTDMQNARCDEFVESTSRSYMGYAVNSLNSRAGQHRRPGKVSQNLRGGRISAHGPRVTAFRPSIGQSLRPFTTEFGKLSSEMPGLFTGGDDSAGEHAQPFGTRLVRRGRPSGVRMPIGGQTRDVVRTQR
ncbi:hypothetical protein GCM10009785_10260 [Brooklawnia cerclae]